MLHVRPVPNFILSLHESSDCVIFSITIVLSCPDYGGRCALDYSGNRTTEGKLRCIGIIIEIMSLRKKKLFIHVLAQQHKCQLESQHKKINKTQNNTN